MRSFWIAPALLAVVSAASAATDTATNTATDTAAESTITAAGGTVLTLSGTRDPMTNDFATGSVTYESLTTTKTLPSGSITAIPTASNGNHSESTTSSDTKTVLVGTQGSSNTTGSGTATSATPAPTNTQPCNGYVEFCARNYSNITYVAAHNSPFDRKGNLASNQAYSVTTQLNDGIRMRTFYSALVAIVSYLTPS